MLEELDYTNLFKLEHRKGTGYPKNQVEFSKHYTKQAQNVLSNNFFP